MNTSELIQRSPLRALDAAIAGGLGTGNLGVVMARHGAGKTPFLVGVALDHLLRGERVLHVSTEQKVDHVREYYEQIFEQLGRLSTIDDAARVHLDMERGRRIHSYLGTTFTVDKLGAALDFMAEHADFRPSLVVVDGVDFARLEPAELEAMLDAVAGRRAQLWMSAVRHRHEAVTDPDGVPEPVAAVKAVAKVILDLQTRDGAVHLELLKPVPATGRQLPLVLDPTTMLVRAGGK
jgi:KaiC/GvpD/RAD55 family RecA-like ATPase